MLYRLVNVPGYIILALITLTVRCYDKAFTPQVSFSDFLAISMTLLLICIAAFGPVISLAVYLGSLPEVCREHNVPWAVTISAWIPISMLVVYADALVLGTTTPTTTASHVHPVQTHRQ